MKIVFTASPRSFAVAILAAFAATTAQLPLDHGTASSVVMIAAGIVCGRLMDSRPGAPA